MPFTSCCPLCGAHNWVQSLMTHLSQRGKAVQWRQTGFRILVLPLTNQNETFFLEAVYQHCTSRTGQLGKPFLPLKPRPWPLWFGWSLTPQLRDGACDTGPRLSEHCLLLATGTGSGMGKEPN